ncbi:hypothetical protein AVEN_250905-1 [Araneus ventricosus]|uniref:Uncharacterized protein n=1 Tax=Araneus ventricosus TaxID=182803 RepID=A0A4Y2S678_ARAVE|nr:hypothetical protein AVEN_250905-1 [Araneus ventricosus]
MDEKIESIIQTINAKMEQQANMIVEMFERLVESLLQNLTAINKLGGETISPSRKKKAVDNLRKASGIPMQLDAGSFFYLLYPRGMEAFDYRSSSKTEEGANQKLIRIDQLPSPLFFQKILKES